MICRFEKQDKCKKRLTSTSLRRRGGQNQTIYSFFNYTEIFGIRTVIFIDLFHLGANVQLNNYKEKRVDGNDSQVNKTISGRLLLTNH